MQPDRRFVEWSRRALTNPYIWPEREPRPPATMLVMGDRGRISRHPISIEAGEPQASIDLDRAAIRFSEPFDENGLADACKVFIITAMREAGERDHKLRWVTWEEPGEPVPCHRVNGRWPTIRLRSRKLGVRKPASRAPC